MYNINNPKKLKISEVNSMRKNWRKKTAAIQTWDSLSSAQLYVESIFILDYKIDWKTLEIGIDLHNF